MPDSFIPHEILAAGTCLVLSGDIAEWLPTSPPLESNVNCIVVPDPRDTDQLARALSSALSDPSALTRIAAAGRASAQFARAKLGMRYEEIFRDALQVPGGTETGGDLVERAAELADRLAPRTHAYCPSLLFATLHALAGTRAAANAYRLVALALAQLSEAPELGVVGRETALFERLLLWLLEDDADSRRLNRASNVSICGAVDHDAFPVLEPGVKIAEFSVDPRGFHNPARTATPLILVFVRDGNTSGRVFETSPVWREVLGACDGARSVADVVSHASGLGIVADDVQQMLSKLVSDRIITVHSKCVPVGARMVRS